MPAPEDRLRDACQRAWADEEERERLLHHVFNSFHPDRVGIHEDTASNFFPFGWHYVSVVDYLGKKVLVVTKM